MFANNNLLTINFSFPDVCYTPILEAKVPLPYPNFSFSVTSPPTVLHMFMGIAFAMNLLESNPPSIGDQTGVEEGIVSSEVGSSQQTILGSIKVFASCAPASRLTSVTTMNGMLPNIIGMTITPAQFRVLLLG